MKTKTTSPPIPPSPPLWRGYCELVSSGFRVAYSHYRHLSVCICVSTFQIRAETHQIRRCSDSPSWQCSFCWCCCCFCWFSCAYWMRKGNSLTEACFAVSFSVWAAAEGASPFCCCSFFRMPCMHIVYIYIVHAPERGCTHTRLAHINTYMRVGMCYIPTRMYVLI